MIKIKVENENGEESVLELSDEKVRDIFEAGSLLPEEDEYGTNDASGGFVGNEVDWKKYFSGSDTDIEDIKNDFSKKSMFIQGMEVIFLELVKKVLSQNNPQIIGGNFAEVLLSIIK